MNINKFLFHSVNETEEMNKELNINLKTFFFCEKLSKSDNYNSGHPLFAQNFDLSRNRSKTYETC